MPNYYVNNNPQPTSKGEHEVHSETCPFLPLVYDKIDLGEHSNCQSAVHEARKYHNNVDGCKVCCPRCHTI